MKRTFINEFKNLAFGDYILFQEYDKNGDVSNPIMAIYLGYFTYDQTVGFYYVRWRNENRLIETQPKIEEHIEWDEHINILGHWSEKPNMKEIMESYRLCEFN